MVSRGRVAGKEGLTRCCVPPRGRLQKLGRWKAQGVFQQERRLRPVDECRGSAAGMMTESLRGRGRRGLPTPGALCGNFGPGGPGPVGRSWRDTGRSERRRVCGADGAEQASHRRVTARRPRSETSSSVTSLLLAPAECVGMGVGRREAPRPGRRFFKAQGWEGPNSGAAPARLPFDWVGEVVASGRLYLRAARGAAGWWDPGLSVPAPSSLAGVHHLGGWLPARIRTQHNRFFPVAPGAAAQSSLCAGGNSGQAGFLGMCLRCWMELEQEAGSRSWN